MLNCQYFDTSYRDSLVLNILIHRFARFVDHVAQIPLGSIQLQRFQGSEIQVRRSKHII